MGGRIWLLSVLLAPLASIVLLQPHVAAQTVANDQLIFVPETQSNGRGITGYYKLPASMHRPVDDGFEFQLVTGPKGQIEFEKKSVSVALQKRYLPHGRLNPKQIII